MKVYSFEKLEVWKISKEFVKRIYMITDKFPYEGRKGIIDQLQRAALSVPNNIAFGSLMECLNLIIISKERFLINNEIYMKLRSEIDEISKKLSNLRRAQLNTPAIWTSKHLNP